MEFEGGNARLRPRVPQKHQQWRNAWFKKCECGEQPRQKVSGRQRGRFNIYPRSSSKYTAVGSLGGASPSYSWN